MTKRGLSVEERLMMKVAEDSSGCWVWTAYKNGAGYGTLYVSRYRRVALAHRVSYEVFVGEIPEGMELDHLCRNRACVNPDHLEPVVHRDNLLRGDTLAADHAARTRCPAGHEYSGIRQRVNGPQRECGACARDRMRRRRAA